jgi:ankyrin repeat protein
MFSKSSKGVLRWLKMLEAWGARVPQSVLPYVAGNYSDCISTPLNPIFIACIWGFPEVLLGLSAIRQSHLRHNSKTTEKSPSSPSHETDLGNLIYELKNKAGTSAFLLAAKNGRIAMMKTMLRIRTGASCCLSMTGEWDNTALHEAATKGSMRVAAFLLNLGAEVNVQNAGGDTPLHLASENGHSGMIHLLITHGANSSVRNYFGHSPTDLAEFRRHRNALQILLSGTSWEGS